MKKKNNDVLVPAVLGTLILIIFVFIIVKNIPSDELNNSYNADISVGSKIQSLIVEDNKLKITTSGNVNYYCVKTTKTSPMINSLCWKEFQGDEANISLYPSKKYYVWIMDMDGNILGPMDINTSGK